MTRTFALEEAERNHLKVFLDHFEIDFWYFYLFLDHSAISNFCSSFSCFSFQQRVLEFIFLFNKLEVLLEGTKALMGKKKPNPNKTPNPNLLKVDGDGGSEFLRGKKVVCLFEASSSRRGLNRVYLLPLLLSYTAILYTRPSLPIAQFSLATYQYI